MAGSEFTLDTKELERLKQAFMRASMFNVDALLHGIGVQEEGEIKERFESKQDPQGKRWKDWSEKTERKSGASILQQSGRLKESVGFESSPQGILWGSTLIYARIHQQGGKAGRGRKVTIPERHYLGIGEGGMELIVETIEDFLTGESGGIL